MVVTVFLPREKLLQNSRINKSDAKEVSDLFEKKIQKAKHCKKPIVIMLL
jgi:hypothetical protein